MHVRSNGRCQTKCLEHSGWSMLCWAQHQHIGLSVCLALWTFFFIAWYQIWLSILLCVIQYDYWAQSDDTPLRRQKDHKIVIFLPSQFCLRPLSIEPPLYKFKCVFQVGPGRMVRLNGVHLCLALFTLAVISTVTAVLLCAHQVLQLNQRKLNP